MDELRIVLHDDDDDDDDDDEDGDDDVVGPNWPYVEGLCPAVIFVLLHVGVACI